VCKLPQQFQAEETQLENEESSVETASEQDPAFAVAESDEQLRVGGGVGSLTRTPERINQLK